jgi:hypothetical protein
MWSAPKQAGRSRTHNLEASARASRALLGAGPVWLRPPSTAHGFYLPPVFDNCPDVRVKPPTGSEQLHGSYKHMPKPNDAYSSQCVEDAILKTKFSTTESTKYAISRSKTPNIFWEGHCPLPRGEKTLLRTSFPLGASILAPTALATMSRFFSQNSWLP